MPLTPAAVVALVQDQLRPLYLTERARLDRIDAWSRWDGEDLKLPRKATWEQRQLAELAKTPWLGLVVSTVAQAMFVDGYRSPDADSNSKIWRTWNRNDMDARQIALHRSALEFGYCYQTVMPGIDPLTGEASAIMRGKSPRNMLCVYDDPAADDWPVYALEVSGTTYTLTDSECIYTLTDKDSNLALVGLVEHGIGLCPVIRFANMLDLEGRAPGEVEPLIGLAQRINKTGHDRLLSQHYNSWKVRTATGMDLEGDPEMSADEKRIRLSQSDMLVAADPNTKFGTLDETPLNGFIAACEADIEALAAIAQVPSHNLTGKMVNLSAEALAAARASLTQKVFERQTTFGKSHAQALRLAARIEGDYGAEADILARVTWQDMEVRSLAQAVDALGKAATMLAIPVQALWPRIPGVTKSDVDDWVRMADKAPEAPPTVPVLGSGAIGTTTAPSSNPAGGSPTTGRVS